MPNAAIVKENGTHMGAKTHHQDQSITLQSLSTIKARRSKLKKPMLAELFSVLLSIC
jgi:hypothetical protein